MKVTWIAALLLGGTLSGCSSVGVGFGMPVGPFSVGVGVGSGGVSAGVGTGMGPVGVGVGVGSGGRVTGGVGVGGSVPIGGGLARAGVGVGTGAVLYDPKSSPRAPARVGGVTSLGLSE